MRPFDGVDDEHHAGRAAGPSARTCSGGTSITPVSDARITRSSVGDRPARRAQAVAIERRADELAVGEHDRRRAVPRLDERRRVAIEALAVVVHRRVPLPRLGDHHHHRVRQRAAAERQQLDHVVELRRVALAGHDDREQPLEPAGELRALQLAAPRLHPVAVAAQRVDLAVVRDVAERLREVPRRERVGREPRVHDRDRARRARRTADRRRTAAAAAGSSRPL